MKLASFKLPPLSRDKSDTLLLLATCTLVLAPHALRVPFWTSLFCALLLLWRGWITFRGHRMPSKWVLLPVALAAVVAVWLTHHRLLGRDPGVTLLAMLVTLKLLEMHARRDLFTVMFASYFLILANFFYTQSIFMALVMALTVVAVLLTQISFQFTGVVPPLKRRLRLAGQVFALAIPVTLVMFLLFPRIQGPLWRMPNDATSGRIGLSETMSPGNISELASSDEVAFRATFPGGAAPPRSQLYWRGLVLSEFDGRTWSPAYRRFQRGQGPASVRVKWLGPGIVQQITLEPSGRPWLFALDLPQGAPALGASGLRAGVTPDAQLVASAPVDTRLRYDVASAPAYALQPDAADLDPSFWLALPPALNPRTMAWARELRAAGASPPELVNQVLRHFRQQPFRYTLSPPLLGLDSVDEFLFDTRAGFCEHYAGSFAVLMRALGIPARVVTGYLGGEVNPVDGFFTVRQSDAHAWTEVWLAGQGWRRVDPTAAIAPDRIERNIASVLPRPALGGLITLDLGRESLLGKLRFNWEAFNNQWNQLVLSYNAERQRDLLRSLGFAQPDWTVMGLLLLGAGSLAMAVAILPLLWNRQHRDPLRALYDGLCRELARQGLARAPHEGPRDYAVRITNAGAAQAGGPDAARRRAAAAFLALYEKAMYAPQAADRRETLARLKKLLNESR